MSPLLADDAAVLEDNKDQWTTITRKKGKTSAKQQLVKAVAAILDKASTRSQPLLSAEDIQRDHDKICSRWRESGHSERLRNLIRESAPSHAVIARAVCLGTGSFDPASESWESKRSAHVQLEAFRLIVDVLSELNGVPITTIAQEPLYTAADKEYLAGLGFEVVDTPNAYESMDATTLVYGIHMYRPIWADVLSKTLPGMFVGTGKDHWEEVPLHLRTDSDGMRRFHEMHERFTMFDFPQEHGRYTFSSTTMYWRKRQDT